MDKNFIDENLLTNYDKSNNLHVPIKRSRFPLRDGIQQKITLASNRTGIFKNITFVKGVENTINGTIADDLLDRFPGYFSVIKQNGRVIEKGKENSMKEDIKMELMNELRENYNITPIAKKASPRDRPAEKELLKDKKGVDAPSSKYQKVK